MNRRMKVLLGITVLVFGGLIAAKAMMNRFMNEFFDNMPVPAATVSSAGAAADTWVREITSVGTVVAVQGADLTTEVSGIIEKIHFDSGSAVKAGDVIVSLDSATDQADLKTLQSAERLAVLERDRVRELWQRKSISKSEFDRRQSELEQAEARVAAQQARIEQKRLRAPYAGRLGIRRINIGQYVNAGDPMIGLQSLEQVFVDFTLPEQRFSDIHVGLPVTARMDALADAEFTGKVSAIEPVIDEGTRNFMVRAVFDNADHQLRPGMFARVALNLGDARQVVVVPKSSISFKPYGNSVYVLTPADESGEDGQPLKKASQRLITTGETRGDLIEVEQGLQEGEEVATSGLLKIRSGGTVIVNNSVVPDAEIAPTPENM
ncbi:efflux RND transporter periplasmic adaptor subunit [Pseudomaricurvus sp. HS19]|uniref:efflux RND transporter periplasmic adaptor subunit n=1 Tax=Pseudomaricurvus sp. HS19 TaxID=2692626 RepID=UPI00136FA8EB|nr:efflux RND transporter periplasmic adaptor subunit [Pseudomaricurvus sp. HS19]MYM64805.1 efflux RND transporter periplasmic adaptor subunit [Pseudomaricurvus sp. HS19]